MTRHKFTMLLVDLLLAMETEGLRPFVDFVKRSDEEQKRLYLMGLSKCDGYVKVSQHQRGRGVDIYFLSSTNKLLEWSVVQAEKWHDWWSLRGGADILDNDLGHFEVK